MIALRRTLSGAIREPLEDAPPIAGYFAFYWHQMDEWLEEDEPAIVHVRDPYHRVDVLESSRHVRVTVNGEVVAETNRPRVIYRDGAAAALVLPARGRPRGSARSERHTTGCAYKGFASYYSVTRRR